MTRAEAIAALREANPRARADEVVMYADAYATYLEAAANIATHGAVVAHPRTGAPIDNPYLRVRDVAMGQLRKFRLKADSLW